MRGFDWINSLLRDELMVKIFRYLETNENQEAASLVCKRWLSLVRIRCETIRSGFSASTNSLVERLIGTCLSMFAMLQSNDYRTWWPDKGMEAPSEGCPLLKDLVISKCPQVTDVGLGYIARNCTSLEPYNMI
ncbi:F-box/LRR-repeat protein 4-like [Forsythia ovata]|uniref:F-box/LRR-repeat protein 4-like n=1 Tax=Forsythia ovata TaxID=205694 RepID=A0ABD1UXT7_9LAMI